LASTGQQEQEGEKQKQEGRRKTESLPIQPMFFVYKVFAAQRSNRFHKMRFSWGSPVCGLLYNNPVQS
jgi:hypothetical protein